MMETPDILHDAGPKKEKKKLSRFHSEQAAHLNLQPIPTAPNDTESDLIVTPSPNLNVGISPTKSILKKSSTTTGANDDTYQYRYFKKPGQTSPVEPHRSPQKKSKDSAYKKITRCLLTAHACTMFQSELWNMRKYGTSNNQYKIPLRGKKNVKEKLLWEHKEVLAQEIIDKERFLISPLKLPYLIWNAFMALLIMYAMTFMPYGLVFMGDDYTKELIENLMNIFFVIDIFVNFFSAYFDEDGQ